MKKTPFVIRQIGLSAALILGVSAAYVNATLATGAQEARLQSVFLDKIQRAFPEIPRGDCRDPWAHVTTDGSSGPEEKIELTGDCFTAKPLGSVWNLDRSYSFRLSEGDLLDQRFAIVADTEGYLVVVDLLAYSALPDSSPQNRISASQVKDDVLNAAFVKALKAGQVIAENRRLETMRLEIEKKMAKIQGQLEK